jgi:hypothetical protein
MVLCNLEGNVIKLDVFIYMYDLSLFCRSVVYNAMCLFNFVCFINNGSFCRKEKPLHLSWRFRQQVPPKLRSFLLECFHLPDIKIFTFYAQDEGIVGTVLSDCIHLQVRTVFTFLPSRYRQGFLRNVDTNLPDCLLFRVKNLYYSTHKM